MAKNDVVQNLPSSLSPRDFSFRNYLHRSHMKCLCQIMVEDVAGLDYIKDKVAKRTEEILILKKFSILMLKGEK